MVEPPALLAWWVALSCGLAVPLALVLLGRLALREGRRLSGQGALGLGGLFLLALVLRFLAPASPVDLNDRLSALWSPDPTSGIAYGLGMSAWSGWLNLWWGWTPDHIFHTNALVGALTAPLLTVAARRAGLSAPAALLSGLFVATHPLLARLSHTDLQTVPEVFLLVGAAWLAFTGSRAWQVGVLLGLAGCFRPESVVPAGLLFIVLAWRLPTLRTPAYPAAALAVVLPWGLTLAHRLGLVLLGQAESPMPSGHYLHPALRHGWAHFPFLDPAYTTPVLGVGVLLGLLAGRRTQRLRTLGFAAGAFLLSSLILSDQWTTAGGISVSLTRHHYRALVLWCLAAGVGWAALPLRFPARVQRPLWAAVALLPLSQLTTMGWLTQTTLLDTEYAFLKAALPQIPDGCHLYALSRPMDASLVPPRHLSQALGASHRWHWVRTGEEPLQPATCALWYQSATCYAHYPPGSAAAGARYDVCDRMLARTEGAPTLREGLPNQPPIFSWFSADPIPVGFYPLPTEAP